MPRLSKYNKQAPEEDVGREDRGHKADQVTLKVFAMTIDKCNTCFGCPRMVLCGP